MNIVKRKCNFSNIQIWNFSLTPLSGMSVFQIILITDPMRFYELNGGLPNIDVKLTVLISYRQRS